MRFLGAISSILHHVLSYSSCRRRVGDPPFSKAGPSGLAGPPSPLPFTMTSSFLSLPSASSVYFSLVSYYSVNKDILELFTLTETGLEPSPSFSFWPISLPPLQSIWKCFTHMVSVFWGLSSAHDSSAFLRAHQSQSFPDHRSLWDKTIGWCFSNLLQHLVQFINLFLSRLSVVLPAVSFYLFHKTSKILEFLKTKSWTIFLFHLYFCPNNIIPQIVKRTSSDNLSSELGSADWNNRWTSWISNRRLTGPTSK